LRISISLHPSVERARRAGIFLEKLKFWQILGSGWRLHGIFSSFQIFSAGQQSKLTEKLQKFSSKHVSGDERAPRAGIFLETIKISDQILGNMFRAKFLSFLEHIFKKWALLKSLCRPSVRPSVCPSVRL
jgi:hypothetical protein